MSWSCPDEPVRSVVLVRRLRKVMSGVLAILVLACCCTQPAPTDTGVRGVDATENHAYLLTPPTTVETLPEDLGVKGSPASAAGVGILDSKPSMGRFPAGLSVVRVTTAEVDGGKRRVIRAEPLASDRSVYWNHVVDRLPPIREVTILRSQGIDPRGGSAADFLRESLNRDCNLCLLYACVLDTPADAEFIAVLWDAARQVPLTFFRAVCVLPSAVREACAEEKRPSPRECDAEYIAEAELRVMVRNHLWDLVDRDAPPEATERSPWRTGQPLFPRDGSGTIRLPAFNSLRLMPNRPPAGDAASDADSMSLPRFPRDYDRERPADPPVVRPSESPADPPAEPSASPPDGR